jgi:prepilin-type processing-associated H-X9-DG protein
MLRRTDVHELLASRHTSWVPWAFTLVELTGVILLLSCLVLLGLPAIVRGNQKSKGANCRANLRQLGLAFQAYSEANNDSLPGPLCTLARAAYDQTSTNQLAWYLAGYLGSHGPTRTSNVVVQLLCPGHAAGRTMSEELTASDYSLQEGQGATAAPFGKAGGEAVAPLKLESLRVLGRPEEETAVTDADKANVNPTLPGWSALPCRPVHANLRNVLFFDWHVGSKQQ